MRCPRCASEDTRLGSEGREADEIVWSVYVCSTCDFHWRDTEPAATIDPALRPAAFQLDPNRLEQFNVILPPKKG